MNAHALVQQELVQYNVRNCSELVSWHNPSVWNSTFSVVARTKKQCLVDHTNGLHDGCMEAEDKTNTALSTLDAQSMLTWVESSKQALKIIEDDVKDAKRRVTAAKPKKKKTADAADGVSENEDVVDSDDAEEN